MNDVSFVQPLVVNILKTTASVTLAPNNFSARPPQAFATVESLTRALFPHPTYNARISSQPVSDDILNWSDLLWFH